tara:strand:+ start:131 stop:685 length:555 start_codon:yes stop_codon:yes gene_type:complete
MVNFNKAVFLDRDGVLVKSIIKNKKGYAPLNLQNFKIYKHSKRCVKKLSSIGFKIFVVTNQPDVGKKILPKKKLNQMHKILRKKTSIKNIYTCIHTAKQFCMCRKPKPGMLIKAAKDHNIDLKKSYMVGDRAKDIACGKRAGCKTIFINRNYKEKKPKSQNASFKNLIEATNYIIERTCYEKIK